MKEEECKLTKSVPDSLNSPLSEAYEYTYGIWIDICSPEEKSNKRNILFINVESKECQDLYMLSPSHCQLLQI